MTGIGAPSGRRVRATAVRLFVTVWLVYGLHFATDIVRETYLAVSLGKRLSIRVDEYLGLHPDLFRIEGRGAYINSSPGASMLGAVPYALARPLIAAAFRLRPSLAEPKPAAEYDDRRPNRRRFFQEARARGLDVELGLAAAAMQVGLMAPAGAAAAVLVFAFLLRRLEDHRLAVWLALLYAFGTPVFFRSAFLNQNVLVAHFVLIAFVLLCGDGRRARRPGEGDGLASGDGGRAGGRPVDPTDAPDGPSAGRLAAAGAAVGLAILCDYGAAPLALAFGVWVLVAGARAGGLADAARRAGAFMAGAAIPLAVLFAYQQAAFGHPLLPAQSYMPDTPYSVRGWNGLTPPDPDLLWRNLADPRFGLLAFCPMLVAAFAAPFVRRGPGGPRREELAFIFGTFLALWLFNACVQFARLQFNTGVRYMVPAVPLLFFALVPVLLRAPAVLRWALVLPTVAISWSVSMVREDVPTSLAHVFLSGFELPWLTVLRKTAGAYAPFLEAEGTSPLPLFVLCGAVLWLLWRRSPASDRHRSPAPRGGPPASGAA